MQKYWREFWNKIKPTTRQRRLIWLLSAVILLALSLLLFTDNKKEKPNGKNINYSTLLTKIEDGKIKSIEIRPYTLIVVAKTKDNKTLNTGLPGQAGNEQLLKTAKDNKVGIKADSNTGSPYAASFWSRIFRVLPMLIFIAIIIWVVISFKPPSISNKNKSSRPSSPETFDDVAGVEEAISELQDIKAFLEHPEQFTKLGAKIPRGVLLYGDPGTGKTLLAKSLANEAGVSFFSANGSDFVEMYAGLGSARVRKLFKEAEKSAPAIIFFDELDALGRKRTSGGDGGTREADQTLNALLTLMDGFERSALPIIIIGATNRLDALDPALIRPGRFDRQIHIAPPDKAGRERILQKHVRGKPLDANANLSTLARKTAGMTGADLANILNEAAILAAKDARLTVTNEDLDDALMRVVAGPAAEHRRLRDEEREIVAVHEAGHALVSERVSIKRTVERISIVPRGQSGGQTFAFAEEDVSLYTEEYLRDWLTILLAGRAAEIIFNGRPTSGSEDDLKKANNIAEEMVSRLGFSKHNPLRIVDKDHTLPDELSHLREAEIATILETSLAQAIKLIKKERPIMQALIDALLDQETLSREEFLALLA